MAKTVIGLLNDIYSSEFENLPHKIKVNGIIFKKSEDKYVTEDTNVDMFERLNDFFHDWTWLNLKVEEVKDNMRWKPEEGDIYHYITAIGEITNSYWYNTDKDRYLYLCRNCFPTFKDAKKHKYLKKVRYELEELANSLNNEKIDWDNPVQPKYHITYNFAEVRLIQVVNYQEQEIGAIYCLNNEFIDKAIDKIGKDDLIDLLKEETE